MSVENNNENGQQQSQEKWLKKINSWNSSMVSIFGLGIVGIVDWVSKLFCSQSLEGWYGISEKYFFSYNYRRIIYIFLIGMLFSVAFFLVSEGFIKKHRNDGKWAKRLSLGANLLFQLFIIFLSSLLLIFQSWYWYVLIIGILLVIIYNIFEYLQKIECRNFVIIFIIIYFIVSACIVILFGSKYKNYELTTIESKDKVSKKVVVLSEYQGKYLVVPYLKKNEVLEMQENKLVYNINEKKSTCKKEYCFFTGSYEFIDKFDYIFKTERINKENIRIVKEELEYISQNQKKDKTTEIKENKDNKDIKNKPNENEKKDITIYFIADKNYKIKCYTKDNK
jgi:membrane protein